MAKREYSEDDIRGCLGVVDELKGDVKSAAKRLGYPQADVRKMQQDRDRPVLNSADSASLKDTAFKFTNDRRDLIIQLLEKGNHRSDVCRAARIDRQTFYNWIDADEEFRSDCEAAEAQAMMDAVENIQRAGREQLQANAWLLDRRSPEWRAPDVKALANTVAKIESALEKLSPDARAEFAEHYQAL